MSKILLRTLAMKSQIGFGKYYNTNTTVQDLITIRNYEALISMYYNLELINFNDEVLSELCISGDLVINKPGRNKDLYKKVHIQLVSQLREIKGFYQGTEHSINPMENYKKRANVIRGIKEQSRIINRDRVQKH